jgi:hypothetical protein
VGAFVKHQICEGGVFDRASFQKDFKGKLDMAELLLGDVLSKLATNGASVPWARDHASEVQRWFESVDGQSRKVSQEVPVDAVHLAARCSCGYDRWWLRPLAAMAVCAHERRA